MGKRSTESEDVATEEEQREWPTRTTVARRLGITAQGVKSLESRGELHPVFVGGAHRFDPAELALVERQRNGGHSPSAQLDIALDMLKQSQRHNERLVELIVNPRSEVLRVLTSTQRSQGRELNRLRSKNFAMLQSHEQIQNEANERKLQEQEFERNQKRRDEAMAIALPYLPKFLNQIVGGLISSKKIKPIAELIGSLSEEQIEVLQSTGFLSDDQKAALTEVRRGLLPAAPATANKGPDQPAKAEAEPEAKKSA